MGLMDVFKAGVKGTAAARAGYLAGEDDARQQTKRDKLTAYGITRQSRLDQIAEARAASQQHRDEAQADWYEKRDTTPKAPPAPHTLQTDEGIMRWDAGAGKFVPTGLHPPERAADRAAARTAAHAKQQATKDAATGVERQIDNTRAELRDLPNMIADDSTVTRIGTEKKSRLDSLTHVSDSLNAELQGRPAKPAAGSRLATLTASTANPAQAAYDDAAARYKRALATPGITKEEAKAAYDATVAGIARKHGQVK